MPSLFSDNVLGFKSRAGKQRARSYNSEGILRRRKQQQQARRFFRFSFRNFAVLLLLLGALTISPSVYFYFVENPNQGCAWLQRPPIICAHGGDSSDAPPNTRAAYQLALDAEVECIEIDASRTRDGFLVALHDRDLQTMSGRPGIRVGDLTLDQIKQLNASRGFLHKVEDQIVQTLEDAIKFVQRPLKQVIIDAKVGPPLFEQQLGVDIISLVRHVRHLQRLTRVICKGKFISRDAPRTPWMDSAQVIEAQLPKGYRESNHYKLSHKRFFCKFRVTVEQGGAILLEFVAYGDLAAG